MKYKALITGNDPFVIDDFFLGTGEFEILTTSTRFKDMIGHIACFKPDLFLYCCKDGSWDVASQMPAVKTHLKERGIPFILVGSMEECDDFERVSPNVADLQVLMPMTIKSVQQQILDFMNKGRARKHAGNQSLKGGSLTEPMLDALSLLDDVEISQRRHILIVDDSPIMLKTIKEHLQDEYDVATAVSGKVAMGFLRRRSTDLILLDYDMPEEDGPAVLARLRASEATKDIPVIFLTGVSDRKKIQEALLMKPQGYLLKPIDHKKLRESIAKAIV